MHIFKLTNNGFVIGNGKYVKIKDEKGFINYFGSSIKWREDEIRKAYRENSLMHNSIHIPADLVIRSLPVNVELLELMKFRDMKQNNNIAMNLNNIYHPLDLQEEVKFEGLDPNTDYPQ